MDLREIAEGLKLLDWFLIGLFLIAIVIQMAYYLTVFMKLPRYKPVERRNTNLPVSIIVCAKNEIDNLKKFLPKLLEQDYPDFEVIVVNDSSTDDTEMLLSELSSSYKHLRFTTIPSNEKFLHGKKLALTIGIKAAKHDLVLLTDADCYPASEHWLQHMASHFKGKTQIVLGYGKYERKKGFLNSLIRYETIFTAMQYLSFALKGLPYMGVGRNLAYKKELFFKNKGFAKHYHIASGDDDLFVNETATKENTAVEFSPLSHTLSIPETTLRKWFKQKKRHLSAGKHYTPSSKIRIAGELLSRMLLYATFIAICISSSYYLFAAVFLAILFALKLIVFKLNMRRLDEKFLLLLLLLFDPILPLVLGGIWFSTFFDTKYQSWN